MREPYDMRRRGLSPFEAVVINGATKPRRHSGPVEKCSVRLQAANM
jgi:hypothetical protein